VGYGDRRTARNIHWSDTDGRYGCIRALGPDCLRTVAGRDIICVGYLEWQAIARMRSGNDDRLSFAQSPDGTTLAVSGEAGTIPLGDGKTYTLRRTLHDDVDGPMGLVVFSPDNKRLLSTSTGGDAELWMWRWASMSPK
jgi:WD40 repeat protein